MRADSVDLDLETTGKVGFNEDRMTPVFAPYSGRVLEVLANKGDLVKAGQPLLFLESPDLVVAANDLSQARSDADKAKIALDAADSSGKPYDAAIALGCVIRGDTIHFEIVSMESSRALMDLAVARRIPLGNGIVTVNTDEQAWARARAGELNKGGDAARAALAMLRIKRRLTRI